MVEDVHFSCKIRPAQSASGRESDLAVDGPLASEFEFPPEKVIQEAHVRF